MMAVINAWKPIDAASRAAVKAAEQKRVESLRRITRALDAEAEANYLQELAAGEHDEGYVDDGGGAS